MVLSQWFSIKSLPIFESEISSKVNLSKWGYVDQIPVRDLDAKVGLLIGSDYPQVLQPHEVVRSQNNGPFAYRTLLGWVVTKPSYLEAIEPPLVHSLYVVKLHQCVKCVQIYAVHKLMNILWKTNDF